MSESLRPNNFINKEIPTHVFSLEFKNTLSIFKDIFLTEHQQATASAFHVRSPDNSKDEDSLGDAAKAECVYNEPTVFESMSWEADKHAAEKWNLAEVKIRLARLNFASFKLNFATTK